MSGLHPVPQDSLKPARAAHEEEPARAAHDEDIPGAMDAGLRGFRFMSPLGEVLLVSAGERLRGLYFAGQKDEPDEAALARLGVREQARADGMLARARDEIGEYFDGRRRRFDLPLELVGTPFQRQVWQALLEIPFGQTATYGAIARRCGRPRAVRAVGAAVGRNPVSIIVPCHRVLGSDGSLTGYAGGLPRKRALLSLEGGAAPGLFDN